ncbi:MAG: ATP synthase F1 subunit delta [Acidobacteriota bacterium]|jgi:F-type H+-transporting ATPase subunit delta
MSVTNIANRYARALADVITERGEAAEVTADLESFAELQRGHADLLAVFASPVVNVERKRAVLNELLSRLALRQTAANFLQLLLTNSRLHQLERMLVALGREIDRRGNFVTAEVTTAREIDEKQKDELRNSLKAATGKEVRLSFRTDPAIIGGVVTRIDSLVYDGSVKNQLAQMKQRLLSAH